jgi:hypothetical protein
MEVKHFEVNVPGKFIPVEEAILGYFYAHPDGNIGTADLTRILKPDQSTTEAFDEIQYGIETLAAAHLVKGKRVSESGKVQYVELRLTNNGEAEAIKQQRREKRIAVTVKFVGVNPQTINGPTK